ncbi:hypothetical protein ACQ33O_08170 [Ferruginibacter sp. SUN002]|uniref:hypothetical protein n=1 Tax=Ferruginibacter sp. SUN002 TaxID=2937789 RepID=UPI003D35C73F
MKTFLFSLSLIFGSCTSLTAQYSDTTISGIPIQFKYDSNIFPAFWREKEINATGTEISVEEIPRSKQSMIEALNKYPISLLTNNLRHVYFLKDMSFYNVSFGGTNSITNLYITNDGISYGFTNTYIEQTFHHEFSSILMRNYISKLDTAAWNAANAPGIVYTDEQGGVGAIANGESSQDIDTALCRRGILTKYALSAMENDLNTLAQNIFKPDEGFWNIVDTYPRIRKKVNLLIDFYHKLDPVFTKSYFRKLK